MKSRIKAARKRVKKKASFYKELSSFVATSTMLLVINVLFGRGYYWSLWPIGIWGIALVSKGISIIIDDKSATWEQKAISEELQSLGYDPNELYDELELKETKVSHKRHNTKPYKNSDLV